MMGFFRNYLPFRWRKISGFSDSLQNIYQQKIYNYSNFALDENMKIKYNHEWRGSYLPCL